MLRSAPLSSGTKLPSGFEVADDRCQLKLYRLSKAFQVGLETFELLLSFFVERALYDEVIGRPGECRLDCPSCVVFLDEWKDSLVRVCSIDNADQPKFWEELAKVAVHLIGLKVTGLSKCVAQVFVQWRWPALPLKRYRDFVAGR